MSTTKNLSQVSTADSKPLPHNECCKLLLMYVSSLLLIHEHEDDLPCPRDVAGGVFGREEAVATEQVADLDTRPAAASRLQSYHVKQQHTIF